MYCTFIFEKNSDSKLIQTKYTLCKCKSTITINESSGLYEQKCNCENGKRFLLYKYAKNKSTNSDIQKYIDNSGPIDTTWKTYMTSLEYKNYIDRLCYNTAYYSSNEFLRLFK